VAVGPTLTVVPVRGLPEFVVVGVPDAVAEDIVVVELLAALDDAAADDKVD